MLQAVEQKARARAASRQANRDLLPFLRAWLSDPLRVAAIAPSGPALARAITAEITAASAPVIELGPGTGVFTKALLDAGVPADRLVAIEYGAEFAALLRRRFPEIRIVEGSAGALRGVELFGPGQAGAVISGLPILSMSPKLVLSILRTMFSELRPGGAMYQFTYGYRCPISDAIMARCGLKGTRISTVLVNAPPASVYRIERR